MCEPKVSLKAESARQEVITEDQHVEAIQDLRGALASKEAEATRIAHTSEKQQQELAECKRKLASSRQECDKVALNLSQCSAENAEVISQNDMLQKDLGMCRAQLREASTHRAVLETKIDSLTAELATARHKLSQTAQALKEQETDCVGAQQTLLSLRKTHLQSQSASDGYQHALG